MAGETLEKNAQRRSKVIQEAVDAADRVIMELSDGSQEEISYITAVVAMELFKKALAPVWGSVLDRDAKESIGLFKKTKATE